MSEEAAVSEPMDLLRRLARHDEHSLRRVLAPTPPLASDGRWSGSSLDRRTRLLVRLAALLVIDAPTNSLRWAVDLASATGADDDDVAAVLVVAGSAAGSAQLVASAPRLAVALGFEPADRLSVERVARRRNRGRRSHRSVRVGGTSGLGTSAASLLPDRAGRGPKHDDNADRHEPGEQREHHPDGSIQPPVIEDRR